MAHPSYEATTTSKTGFFDLPPELREQIYRYVLPDTVNLSVSIQVRAYRRYRRYCSVALLLTCRTIHMEAAPLYYRETIFLFKCFSGIGLFLRGLTAAKRAWVANLYLPLQPWEVMTHDDEGKAKILESHARHLERCGLKLRQGVLKTSFIVDGKEVWAAQKPDGSR